MTERWDDLSDDELRERLSRAGCDRPLVLSLVNNRDDERVAELIRKALEGSDL